MTLKSQTSLLVSTESLDHARKLSVRYSNEDPESEDMQSLIQSIKKFGIRNALHIFPKGNGRFEVVSGNRRLAAARALRLEWVPAQIVADSAVRARRWAFADNEARLNSKALEKAKAIRDLYKDVGIDPKVAIMKVKHMYNLKTDHPKEYEALRSSQTPATSLNKTSSTTRSNNPLAEPTPEFLEVFREIPYSPNTQYQLLQTICQIPAGTMEILEQNPNLGMDKAITLTHSRLKAYPETVRQFLATQIIKPEVNVTKARHMVNQMVDDLEHDRVTVDKEGNIDLGYSNGMGYRSDPEENVDTPQRLELPFSAEILDIDIHLRKTINKILHIQIPRGDILYSPEIYEPALEDFEKNLAGLKKGNKQFCAIHAAIVGRICEAIVDSAR